MIIKINRILSFLFKTMSAEAVDVLIIGRLAFGVRFEGSTSVGKFGFEFGFAERQPAHRNSRRSDMKPVDFEV